LDDPARFASHAPANGNGKRHGTQQSLNAAVKSISGFFTKGRPTEKIWYFDLSAVKVGKKTPLTQAHFEEFFKLLPTHGDSPNAWTVDFAAKQQAALEQARPLREKATALFAQAKTGEDEWGDARKTNYGEAKAAAAEAKWRATEREAREALSQAQGIEEAIYDLKAVNPNRTSEEDTRTPQELLDFIETKGREADAALAKLRGLIAAAGPAQQAGKAASPKTRAEYGKQTDNG
jgi:type I restriction enzyme M protein